MPTEDKDARIAELEALVAGLRQQLRAAQATIDRLQRAAAKRFRHDHDYVPYDEEDRR